MTYTYPNLTPSRVPALNCRKRFEAEYLAKSIPSEGFARSLAYGSAVHETLKKAFDPRNSTSTVTRDVRAFAVAAMLRQGYTDEAERLEDLEKCVATVEAYRAQSSAEEITVGVEVFANALVKQDAKTLPLGARFDRTLFWQSAPNRLIIRDYKTGKPTETDIEGAAIMLAIAALRSKGNGDFSGFDSFAVEYDFVSTEGLVERRAVTFAEAKTVWSDLKSRALGIYQASEFPAEPGEHCVFCPLRKACQPDLCATIDDLDALFQ